MTELGDRLLDSRWHGEILGVRLEEGEYFSYFS